jgi:hypothetical protein
MTSSDRASLKLDGRTLHHRGTETQCGSAASVQLSAFSVQLPAVSHRLLAVGVWLLALRAHGGRAKSSRPAKKRRISSTEKTSRIGSLARIERRVFPCFEITEVTEATEQKDSPEVPADLGAANPLADP